MEQGIHGTGRHNAVFGKLLVAGGLEVAGKGLQIAVLITALALDDPVDLPCQIDGLLLAGGAGVGCQRIDGKRLIIGVLGIVANAAVVIDRPVTPPISSSTQ